MILSLLRRPWSTTRSGVAVLECCEESKLEECSGGNCGWLVECWNNSLFSVEWTSECGEEGPNGGMVGIETSIFRRHECTGQALWKSVGFVRPCPAAYIVNVEELLVESWWDFGCPHSFCLVDSFVDSVFS